MILPFAFLSLVDATVLPPHSDFVQELTPTSWEEGTICDLKISRAVNVGSSGRGLLSLPTSTHQGAQNVGHMLGVAPLLHLLVHAQ